MTPLPILLTLIHPVIIFTFQNKVTSTNFTLSLFVFFKSSNDYIIIIIVDIADTKFREFVYKLFILLLPLFLFTLVRKKKNKGLELFRTSVLVISNLKLFHR